MNKIDELVSTKPDYLIVHAGTNDLTNEINPLNNVTNIVKNVKKISPNTKVVFSNIVVRKDRKGIAKKVQETKARLKYYTSQKGNDYIENTNIKEIHLGVRKLHLNKKGNSVFAKNLLNYLNKAFGDDCNCLRVSWVNDDEYKFKQLNDLSEDVSVNSLKAVRLKNLNRIIIAYLNINSLRKKSDLLTEQVKTNVDVLVISETTVDSSFPVVISVAGFCTPFRKDRDQFGGGIMVFVREDIPSKLLSLEAPPIESLYIESLS